MKTLSAGLLIKTSHGFLQCHPTGRAKDQFDIPKGHVEDGEDPWEAATRELFEETGMVLLECNIKKKVDLGRLKYNPRKDLYIFYIETYEPLKIEQMQCNSTFETEDGRILPEMDGYRYSKTFDGYFKNLKRTLELIENKPWEN